MTAAIAKQTLYFDTERSGFDYISDYDNLPGVQGPLWHDRKIPVLGVHGEIGSGKTTFMLDIACGPVKYMDIPGEMVKLYPNGYRPLHVYLWFMSVIKAIPAGMFRVIALDVAEEIEAGLAEWVWDNALYFNHTQAQYKGMPAIYQSDITNLWKLTLGDLSSRCETFAFANHMGHVWGEKKPTGERKAKGRPVLKQLAAMIVRLERKKDEAGNVPARPSGSIDIGEGGKARLRRRVNGEWAPILPPRLPVASPDAIRAYILTPPDYRNLKPEERVPDHIITEDDRVMMRKEAAEAEGNAAALKMQLLEEERRHGGVQSHESDAAIFADHVSAATTQDNPDTNKTLANDPTTSSEPVAPSVQEVAPASPAGPEVKPMESVAQASPTSAAEGNPSPTPTPAGPAVVVNMTAPTPAGETTVMWEEFAFLNGWDQSAKGEILKAFLDNFKASSIKDANEGQHAMMQQWLHGKIADLRSKRNSQAPFE